MYIDNFLILDLGLINTNINTKIVTALMYGGD